jgi:hypothetical protein
LDVPTAASTVIDALFREDRDDRAAIAAGHLPAALLDERDDRRVRTLRRLLDQSGEAGLSALHAYRAAVIFQHGPNKTSVRRARRLAVAAARGGLPEAKHLAAAALDRLLMYANKPQRYGTQYRRIEGRWQVWPVRASTTDSARRACGVPPFVELQRRADAWNSHRSLAPCRG